MTDKDSGHDLERGVTPDEARQTPSKNTAAEVEALKPSPDLMVERTHRNTGQELIHITGDRVKLILSQTAEHFTNKREWHGPLGLFAGLITSFATSDFKAKPFGMDGNTVKGIVLCATFIAGVWLVRSLHRSIRTPSKDAAIKLALDAFKHQGSA